MPCDPERGARGSLCRFQTVSAFVPMRTVAELSLAWLLGQGVGATAVALSAVPCVPTPPGTLLPQGHHATLGQVH